MHSACDIMKKKECTNVLCSVYDAYLSWLGDGVLVRAIGSFGSRVLLQRCVLSPSSSRTQMTLKWLSAYTPMSARSTHSVFVHQCAH